MLKITPLNLALILMLASPAALPEPDRIQQLKAAKQALDAENRQLREALQRDRQHLMELEAQLKIWRKKIAALDKKIRAERAREMSQTEGE